MDHLRNSTIQTDPVANGSINGVFWLFRLSFMLYPVIGFVVSMVIGQVGSWLTGGTKQQIDENLLIPFFQSVEFKQRVHGQQCEQSTRYTAIDQMLVETMRMEKRTANGNQHNDDDNDDDDEAIVTVADVKKPTTN